MELDFDSLKNAVELAGNAGSATGKVAKGVETLLALFKGSDAGDSAELKMAFAELVNQVAEAKVANSDLKQQLLALGDELARLQAFKSDLERYELWETAKGAIVFRLKATSQNDEPMHYLCPNCAEEKRKRILQGDIYRRLCPSCKTEFLFEPRKPRKLPRMTY